LYLKEFQNDEKTNLNTIWITEIEDTITKEK
jgi:hypothetical protein